MEVSVIYTYNNEAYREEVPVNNRGRERVPWLKRKHRKSPRKKEKEAGPVT
jgi:hypothetical protein